MRLGVGKSARSPPLAVFFFFFFIIITSCFFFFLYGLFSYFFGNLGLRKIYYFSLFHVPSIEKSRRRHTDSRAPYNVYQCVIFRSRFPLATTPNRFISMKRILKFIADTPHGLPKIWKIFEPKTPDKYRHFGQLSCTPARWRRQDGSGSILSRNTFGFFFLFVFTFVSQFVHIYSAHTRRTVTRNNYTVV